MQEKDIDDIVEKHGWFAANIADAEPPFLFSIGLMKTFDHPELIVFGLEKESAYALMSSLIDHLREGRTFNENGKYTVTVGDDQHEIALRQVHPTQHPLHLGFAMGYCRFIGRWGELDAYQVFWPDRQGKFPFEAGCDEAVFHWQPRTDIPMTQDEIDEFDREYGS